MPTTYSTIIQPLTHLQPQPQIQSETKPKVEANRPTFQTQLKKFLTSEKPVTSGKKKFTLVLDLDETLIHSEFVTDGNHSFSTTIKNDTENQTIYVYKRPYADEFLEQVAKLFEVVIFTAGSEPYAKAVIDILDKNKVVSKCYYRDSCLSYRNCYVKDLRILNIPLSNIAIVDNSPISYCIQPKNAIPITTWINDPNDTELLNLLPFLKRASMSESFVAALEENDLLEYGFIISPGAKIKHKIDPYIIL
ncbi:NLI interacting factor-like phosphatase [Babesia microti strain RI]|uniref:NLI interacting factor-like phosphatase n=1 Tax=Babesia microti (strain RI) TaxID=1133968 RepID=I7J7Z4_BABMR|nr:NLI interacting factor-like phosphatase [Babesia microti strain RI]CCF72554.1 NLI interacting factor-like phosphatase [Babesia microti strain RI]|eukprot:XP_012647163.1 NLI interacting factor-like phosphatase [Babesia microti strain RI]